MMAIHKSANYIKLEQLNQSPELFAVIKYRGTGRVKPITIGKRQTPPEIVNGLQFTDKADYRQFWTSHLRVTSEGYFVREGVSGSYYTSGYAELIIDCGYPPAFTYLVFGVENPSGCDAYVELETANDKSDLVAAPTYGPYRSGAPITDLPPAQYLKIRITMTGTVTDMNYFKHLRIFYEPQKHYGNVISWGTLSGTLPDGNGTAYGGLTLTTHNIDGAFSELIANVPITGRELSIVTAPPGATAGDYIALYTGIVQNAELTAKEGRIIADKTQIELLRTFPRLRQNDFGRTDDGYLPCPFGDIDTVQWRTDEVNDIANHDKYHFKIVFFQFFDNCPTGIWHFTMDDFGEFEVTDGDGNSYGTINLNRSTIIKSGTTNYFRIKITVRPSFAVAQEYWTEGDNLTIQTICRGLAPAVRIDPGTSTDDDGQIWALSQYPIKQVDSIWQDGVKLSSSEYTVYTGRYYGGHKIAYVKIDTGGFSSITWAGKGFKDQDQNCPTNPAAIAIGLTTWRPGLPYLLATDYIDMASYNATLRFIDSLGVSYSGFLPDAEFTYMELVQHFLKFLSNIDLSEGILRLVPIDGTAPGSNDILTSIHWTDMTDDGFQQKTGDITKRITYIEGYWGYTVAAEQKEKRKIEITSDYANEFPDYLTGYEGSPGIIINLPYAANEATARAILQNWLSEYEKEYYIVTITTPSLKYATVELGDKHVGFTHPKAANATSNNVGLEDQPMKIIGKIIDFDRNTVTLIGKVYECETFSGLIGMG